MLSKQQTTPKIRLSRMVDDTRVEVWLDGEDDVREGYASLKRLCWRIKMESCRERIEGFWIRDDSRGQLDESVVDSVHRVALSLFENWPSSSRVRDIKSDTGLSQSYISGILAGTEGNAASWFVKCGALWNLSRIGESKILKEVAPSLESKNIEGI